jgi:endogenous inhibitor of DNA gyrase (YacG/DUF329 family)
MCDACIEWGGKVWHSYNGKHYQTMVYMHREVWEAANGPIPRGFHVHHKNHDQRDNRLENFELLSHSDHSRRHVDANLGPSRARAVKNAHAAMARNRELRRKAVHKCVVCNGAYHSAAKHPAGFCSSRCLESARSNAFTGDNRLCEHCGTGYTATRRVQRFCSKRCNAHATEARAATLEVRDVACADCGTVFQSKRANARFCGRPCALHYHGLHSRRGKISDMR